MSRSYGSRDCAARSRARTSVTGRVRTAGAVLAALFATVDSANAQILPPPSPGITSPPKHAIYAELGGPGGLYSVGYERIRTRTSYQLGVTYWDLTGWPSGERLWGVIGGTFARYDLSEHAQRLGIHVEAGFAASGGRYTIAHQTPHLTETFLIIVGEAGLRHQPDRHGWMWRVMFMPTLPLIGKSASSWPPRSPTLAVVGSVGWAF